MGGGSAGDTETKSGENIDENRSCKPVKLLTCVAHIARQQFGNDGGSCAK